MDTVVDRMMDQPPVAVLAYFSLGILALIVFLSLFEKVTRYDVWEEIRKGNVAAGMATGGKIFGICNIFRFSIEANGTIYESMLWAGGGFLLLLVAYFLFEFLTPVFKIDEEITRDNRAVGLLAMIIPVSLSYIIGAAIE